MIAGIVVGILGTLALTGALGLTITHSGAFSVAASDRQAAPLRRTLYGQMRRSVEARAEAVAVPASFTDATVREGATLYADACAQCHGAPGVAPEAWAERMHPAPRPLTAAVAEWRTAQLRWIIEHGIGLSGMPGFRDSHSEEEILALTAFVAALPHVLPHHFAEMTNSPAAPVAPADDAGTAEIAAMVQ
jgi:mono/diheme cytochrome c family protein